MLQCVLSLGLPPSAHGPSARAPARAARRAMLPVTVTLWRRDSMAATEPLFSGKAAGIRGVSPTAGSAADCAGAAACASCGSGDGVASTETDVGAAGALTVCGDGAVLTTSCCSGASASLPWRCGRRMLRACCRPAASPRAAAAHRLAEPADQPASRPMWHAGNVPRRAGWVSGGALDVPASLGARIAVPGGGGARLPAPPAVI